MALLLVACGCAPARPGVSPRCPAEMRAVSDAEGRVRYCIDAWEVVVTGALGGRDQYAANVAQTQATARSSPGVPPTAGVTYGQAQRVCANTPALDAEGRERGRKRLPTVQEWLDAGDGVYGQGGARYPYGDQPVPGRCACGINGLTPYHRQVQPTGALADCVSAFGVHDLSGNLWEWADSGFTYDIDGWRHKASALALEITADGYVRSSTGDRDVLHRGLLFDVHDLRQEAVVFDGEQRVTATIDWERRSARYAPIKGHLVLNTSPQDPRDPRSYLPVTVAPSLDDLRAPALFRVMRERDGQPLTHKLGGAWYTADPDHCPVIWRRGAMAHPHDFQGTIGFRCAADPLPEDSN